MFNSTLQVADLNEKEALVYTHIVRSGKSTAADLLRATTVKRGDLYNVLRRLEEKRFIFALPDAKKLTYAASDPEVIERAVTAQERLVQDSKLELPLLFSAYNLASGKPGIRYFEGVEGIKEAYQDSLTATTEILAYADADGVLRVLGKKYAAWYAAERRRRKIRERLIVPDTALARRYFAGYDMAMTQHAFVPHEKFAFAAEMNIYDHKVFYTTFREPYIAVLIEDRAIADTQRAIFELGWSAAG